MFGLLKTYIDTILIFILIGSQVAQFIFGNEMVRFSKYGHRISKKGVVKKKCDSVQSFIEMKSILKYNKTYPHTIT